jgi:hypothetical protein
MHTDTGTRPLSLCLAPHVRACDVGGQVILLDLRHNRYLGIGGPASPSLAGHVRGWPEGTAGSGNASPTAAQPLIDRFLHQGLLTVGETPMSHASVMEATSSIDAEPAGGHAPLHAMQVLRFLRAAAKAALWLRWRSLDTIVASVAKRHARVRRHAHRRSRPATLALASTYERLRPLALSAEDQCLRDSLALMNFLSAEGASAQWVIGVKARPFGAHSWVQLGPTVLNDQHEHVRRFTPILVV